VLLITKELVPLSFVEAPFFRKLVLTQNLHFNFPSKWVSKKGLLLKVAKKTKENFVYFTCFM
jgi:hypothetical protein